MSDFPEMDEQKPKIMASGQYNIAPSSMFTGDQLHMETSESVPKLHTDTSSSEQVVSPDFTCEKEVQSEAKWKEMDNAFDFFDSFQFNNYMDDGFAYQDPFASQVQYQMDQIFPVQDMFM